ncbi:MAG: hypothetical protein HY652_10945 [Acidobacteria bacterium]|nr:hypothetical protein [Acidobacteriota bacterium]
MKAMKTGGVAFLCIALAPAAWSGVTKEIEQQYRAQYENKALFLRIPISGPMQRVFVDGVRLEEEGAGMFKVGDQVRILGVDFQDSSVKFKIASLDVARKAEIEFVFPGPLDAGFSARSAFDRALDKTFTQGLTLEEIEGSKREFIQDRFDPLIADFSRMTNTSPEFVISALGEKNPQVQELRRQVQFLSGQNKELSDRLASVQAEAGRADQENKRRTEEINRLKSSYNSLREQLEVAQKSEADLSRELKKYRDQTSYYQAQMENLQKILYGRVEGGDLRKQFEDVSRNIRKIQGDYGHLETRLRSLTEDYQKTLDENKNLQKSLVETQDEREKLAANLKTVTSQGDTLGRKFLALQQEHEQLRVLTQARQDIRMRLEHQEGPLGRSHKTLRIFLGDLSVARLFVDAPEVISAGRTEQVRSTLAVESVDFVKLSPAQREIFRSLGKKWTAGQRFVHLPPGVRARLTEPAQEEQAAVEREKVSWTWQVENRGPAAGGELNLETYLTDARQQPISLGQVPLDLGPGGVARFGRWLQPIPLMLGMALGLLVFGLVGVLVRSRRPHPRAHRRPSSEEYVAKKEL